MSKLRVNELEARTGTTIDVPSSTTLYAPGHIIQTLQSTYDTATSTTSATHTTILTVNTLTSFITKDKH